MEKDKIRLELRKAIEKVIDSDWFIDDREFWVSDDIPLLMADSCLNMLLALETTHKLMSDEGELKDENWKGD